jgi:hypothetical protein
MMGVGLGVSRRGAAMKLIFKLGRVTKPYRFECEVPSVTTSQPDETRLCVNGEGEN